MGHLRSGKKKQTTKGTEWGGDGERGRKRGQTQAVGGLLEKGSNPGQTGRGQREEWPGELSSAWGRPGRMVNYRREEKVSLFGLLNPPI